MRDTVDDLAKLTVDDFLERVASRTPSPGGGSVAAVCGALAAALARMVVAYSTPRDALPPAPGSPAHRLRLADELLRALITRDATAYAAMSTARPKGGPQTDEYEKSVLAALAVPLEIAATAAEVLATLNSNKAELNRHLHSDLGAACALADAAAHAARFMVQVNAAELSDGALRDRLLGDINRIVQHCDHARGAVESFLRQGS